MDILIEIGKKAKAAAGVLAAADSRSKNEALRAIASALSEKHLEIERVNAGDVERARESGMKQSMLDRLTLNSDRVAALASAVEDVIGLSDPVGKPLGGVTTPNGLQITKISVPFGVVAMIFEARPNVTVDSAVLSLKSGNACILRGGKESFETNMLLCEIMREAIASAGLPEDCVQLIPDTSRETAVGLMKLSGYVDLLIPRGGAGLIRTVVENATVPVIETGVGNCHVYVDESADLDMAVDIIVNAKTTRPSVCNSAESLLVHEKIAWDFLPMAKAALDEKNVVLHGCEKTLEILDGSVVPATEEDYYTEYLDFHLSVKVVPGTDAAIEHINTYGTKHSDAIVTKSYPDAMKFTKLVDSAAVYVNASTRFTDGGEFGFGAEIGISTQKLHSRGPIGLPELCTNKYVIMGSGQVR